MTATPLVTIFCDAPDCGEWDEDGVGETAKEARAGARRVGWAVGLPGGTDLCPRHRLTVVQA